jgi:hypothetical protein
MINAFLLLSSVTLPNYSLIFLFTLRGGYRSVNTKFGTLRQGSPLTIIDDEYHYTPQTFPNPWLLSNKASLVDTRRGFDDT